MIDQPVIELRPIGVIHSPYKMRAQAPYQGCGINTVSHIEIFREYEEGLTDIEGFSHIIVMYYFHKSSGYTMLVRTPWDSEPHGLFTTRSPNRPCPIGLSIVTLLARERNTLKVKELDAIEGSPVLDIKPYVTGVDSRDYVREGWLQGKLTR